MQKIYTKKFIGVGSEAFNVSCKVWLYSTTSRTLTLSSKIDAGGAAVNVCSDSLALDTAPLKLYFDSFDGSSSALFSQWPGLASARLPKATTKMPKCYISEEYMAF